MSNMQFGSLGTAVLVAAGIVTAFGSSSPAQDAPVMSFNPGTQPQAVYPTENQVGYAPQYATMQYRHACCGGGPYKGFYPCNGMTPYYGGACNVYGDAPIYTAPADFGFHHAAFRP
jgi:hypothetical protein